MNGAGWRSFFSRPAVKAVCWMVPAAGYLGFVLATLPLVPFHPDESTYMYMSGDLDRIFASGPVSICWRAAGAADPLQVERERDCPLARYAIGLARRAAGLPALMTNWDWGATWNENRINGALPPDSLLWTARIPQAVFLFLAVLLMARIGWRLGRIPGAISAALLFGFNSQVLLHARRAMAESALLFGMILVVAVVLEYRPMAAGRFRAWAAPILAGAALAVATLAKYSGLLLAPAALAGMFPAAGGSSVRRRISNGLARCGVLILVFGAVFLAFDPVLWCDPAGAVSAVVRERGRLMGEQSAALQGAAPGSLLSSSALRLLAVPYELFLAPPAFWDIPNYAAETAAAERAYLAFPLQVLTAGGILAAGFAVLGLIGLGLVMVRAVRRKADAASMVVLLWFVSVLIGILVGVPILWQRYYLPLVPAFAALAAVGVTEIVKIMDRIYRISHPLQDRP
jgi:hypothetical protein